MTRTWEEDELMSLQQEEVQSYFGDLKDELEDIRGVVFMCGSHIHRCYTGFKYEPLSNLGKRTKYMLDSFQTEINILIEELDEAVINIYNEIEPDEEFDLLEEMHDQAADYFYDKMKDEELET